ncbi:hypothetical protein T05_15272 [Trichinella murrelli]|uniref:Uncharacterized protein n=1 Tax=Trichinella murrelli TaxID=144512 RepID=A0A0V0TWS3_9BILA|nr:hypothetical protein T05_15272 [Trichinella murrelli]
MDKEITYSVTVASFGQKQTIIHEVHEVKENTKELSGDHVSSTD